MTTTISPEMAYIRLAQLKGILSLESKGMKGRIGPIRPKIAAEFGLKPRDSYEKFIEVAKARMEELLAKKQEEVAA